MIVMMGDAGHNVGLCLDCTDRSRKGGCLVRQVHVVSAMATTSLRVVRARGETVHASDLDVVTAR
jgi:hypothetical protein